MVREVYLQGLFQQVEGSMNASSLDGFLVFSGIETHLARVARFPIAMGRQQLA